MGGVGVGGGQDSQQNNKYWKELHIEASVGALKSEGVIFTTVFVMLLASDSEFFYRWRNCDAVFQHVRYGKYPDETEISLWRNYSV